MRSIIKNNPVARFGPIKLRRGSNMTYKLAGHVFEMIWLQNALTFMPDDKRLLPIQAVSFLTYLERQNVLH